MTSLLPYIPPRSTSLPPVGGVIGSSPEHFFVEEIPAYPLSGSGEHLFFFIEKRELTTTEVAKRLADAGNIRARDVGYAGMKDKNAVTRQWYSLCSKAENAQDWDLGSAAKILTVTRHNNKLRTGHLIGNKFALTLTGTAEDGYERAQAIAQLLSSQGLANYFGPQRFGREGRNLAEAYAWLNAQMERSQAADGPSGESAEGEPVPEERESRSRKRSRKKGRGDDQRFADKLMPSVIQSEFFNRYTAARLARPEPLLKGEVVRLDGAGKHFIVEDVAAETPRKLSGDLHLTGPMHGPKTLQSHSDALELETQVLTQMGLSPEHMKTLGAFAPGARRDLLLAPQDLVISAGDSADQVRVSFSLPAGGYATNLMYEFTDGDWTMPRG